MILDLRLCIVRSKKDGKWWFLRDRGPEYEPQFETLAGPFNTKRPAQNAMDEYNRQKNGWAAQSPHQGKP